MRIALCLSGHLRTFDSVAQYFKQTVVDPLNCDIFIHTWESIGAPTGKTHGDNINTHTSVYNILPNVYKIFKPKKVLIENEDIVNQFIRITNDINIHPNEKQFIVKHLGYHVSMFYSIYMANKLKSDYEQTNNFVYDRVFRCRPDIRFGTVFNRNMFSDPNKIYLPKIATYCPEGLNDQVAVGSSLNMDKYSSIYHEVVNYYRHHATTARPEALIKYHIEKQKIFYTKQIVMFLFILGTQLVVLQEVMIIE